MKERTIHRGNLTQLGRRVDLDVEPPETAAHSGIEVQEEQWGSIAVQRVYKMRCECGRSWFDLELPQFVRCPAAAIGSLSSPSNGVSPGIARTSVTSLSLESAARWRVTRSRSAL
jgi:hypothetical protein